MTEQWKDKPLTLDDIGTENLERLILATALSMPEVSSMAASFTEAIASSVPGFGNEELQGVTISERGGKISTDLYLKVWYGTEIPNAAWQIQNAVQNAVKEVLGITLKNINIHIVGVEFPENESTGKEQA